MTKNTIVESLRKQIEKFKDDVKAEKVGHVIEVFDGIAKISGLSSVKASEMVSGAEGPEPRDVAVAKDPRRQSEERTRA